MNLFELQTAIKQNKLPKFLIFTGNEYAIIELYINQIASFYKLNKISVNQISQVVQKQKIISLLGDNNLYVCRYDTMFIKSEKEWAYINKSLGTNYLILITTPLDKRGKFYKQFESQVVEFSEQDINTVKLMLKSLIKLSDESLTRLITGCGLNYSKCVLEIDKIKTIANVRNIDSEQAYELLLNDGVICEQIESKLPVFVNAVMRKNKNCYELYDVLKKNSESNVVILAWLYNAVRNQLIVQNTVKTDAETTGLSYFFVKECLERKNYYTTKELLGFLQVIKQCEQGIKLGTIEEQNCIDYILVNVL